MTKIKSTLKVGGLCAALGLFSMTPGLMLFVPAIHEIGINRIVKGERGAIEHRENLKRFANEAPDYALPLTWGLHAAVFLDEKGYQTSNQPYARINWSTLNN